LTTQNKNQDYTIWSLAYDLSFGGLVDRVKEIIKKLKEKFKKPIPAQTVIVHQYKDYNNIG
tara:strand:- start:666 stop:848 length:183 start_codon:yes stop_codon:yes gene_type:complete